ncbi:hypothetical protein BGZ99_005379 [Dissophora globulifera]|uniref:Uncharacterized protein n=1 Tax=Dissophora globulifera TaxID=979702 RepID=A0A9P6UTE7_9FUNG|nr:hypothetical protein BGZ99_005379 [Dissophora globulifera]
MTTATRLSKRQENHLYSAYDAIVHSDSQLPVFIQHHRKLQTPATPASTGTGKKLVVEPAVVPHVPLATKEEEMEKEKEKEKEEKQDDSTVSTESTCHVSSDSNGHGDTAAGAEAETVTNVDTEAAGAHLAETSGPNDSKAEAEAIDMMDDHPPKQIESSIDQEANEGVVEPVAALPKTAAALHGFDPMTVVSEEEIEIKIQPVQQIEKMLDHHPASNGGGTKRSIEPDYDDMEDIDNDSPSPSSLHYHRRVRDNPESQDFVARYIYRSPSTSVDDDGDVIPCSENHSRPPTFSTSSSSSSSFSAYSRPLYGLTDGLLASYIMASVAVLFFILLVSYKIHARRKTTTPLAYLHHLTGEVFRPFDESLAYLATSPGATSGLSGRATLPMHMNERSSSSSSIKSAAGSAATELRRTSASQHYLQQQLQMAAAQDPLMRQFQL